MLVLAGQHVDPAGYEIAKAIVKTFGRVNVGSGNDGIVKGYVGFKHEARGDFSFGLSDDPMSMVLFLLLVSGIRFYAVVE